jgi:hypothetical protein
MLTEVLILKALAGGIRFLAQMGGIRRELTEESVPEVHFQSQVYNPRVESKGIRAGFSSSTLVRADKIGENPHP